MKHDQLNDELLALVTAGTNNGHGGGAPGRHGNGTGGGDGLGWLRHLLREIGKTLRL